MGGYKDLEIYQMAFELAVTVHKASLDLPRLEMFEQGSQIRRSSKTIKDTIAEGYGRRRYKAEYIRYLVYALSSCDEVISQIDTIKVLYPEKDQFKELSSKYDTLSKKINQYLKWVENNWKGQ